MEICNSRQELLGTYFIDIAAMFFAMPQALYPALAIFYGEQYIGFFRRRSLRERWSRA